MKLTIGMAHYDDYDGAYFTSQALALYQELGDAELIIVDNSPHTPAGKDLRNLVHVWLANGPCKARYVPLSDAVGTSVPRDTVFREATGDVVLCMDCHVMLWPGALTKLRAWYEAHPDSRDLLSGPLMYDDLSNMTTHFDDRWRGEMWGTWGQAWRCRCGDATFAATDEPPERPGHDGESATGVVHYRTLLQPQVSLAECPVCHVTLPTMGWVGHEKALAALGHVQLGALDHEPFEIPGMGLGMFACRKDAWPGFHPHARGFGGEELYIHEKIRRNGGKNWCMPWLRWVHRFGRPGGVKYPLDRYAKVRNYVLEFQELGWDLDIIREHFVDTHRMTPGEWKYLLEDPVRHVSSNFARQAVPVEGGFKDSGLAVGSGQPGIDELFELVKAVPRDLNERAEDIRDLAAECAHVTLMGKRREWDAIILAGRPKTYISYNTEHDLLTKQLHEALEAEKTLGEEGYRTETFTTSTTDFATMLATDIEETDMLVLDTIPTADRTYAELTRFAPKVRKWIVLNNTILFGESGEGGGPGILVGWRRFQAENPKWKRVWEEPKQFGFSILSCEPGVRSIDYGPGTEMSSMLHTVGINPRSGCDCHAKALQMDKWGVDGCRENRELIVGWIREGAPRWSWAEKLRAVANAAISGLAWTLDPMDPYGSLVDEAIRRAEEKEADMLVNSRDL